MKNLPVKRLILAGIALIAVIAVIVIVAVVRSSKAGLSVDGNSITKAEFNWAVDEVKNDVAVEMAPQGSSFGPEFWDDTAKDSPSYKVGEQAVDILKHRYAVYEIAVGSGLLDSASWDSLMTRFEADNERRSTGDEQNPDASASPDSSDQSAGASNEDVVYGPSALGLSEYVDYEMSSIEESYISNPQNPGMNVSDEEISEHYASKEWTNSDGDSASLDEVYSNVVDDLLRTKFQAIVSEKEDSMKVRANYKKLASSVKQYLGS